MRTFTSYRIGLMAAAGAALCAAGGLPALAQNAPVAFTNSVAPLDEAVTVLGAPSSQAGIRFTIALKLRNYAALADSNASGKVMTPAQMARDHLPTQADYDKVLNWAVHSGLTVDKTSKSRMTVDVSGNVAIVSRVLGVHFSRVRSEGQEYISADSAPALPESIAAVVNSVNGLQPQQHAFKTNSIQTPMAHTAGATTVPYYAQAFVTGYSATGLGKGGINTTTAIVIDVFPLASDLQAYWKRVGAKQKIANVSFINTTGLDIGAPSGEESMDAEVSSAIAPKSKLRIYASGDLKLKSIDKSFQHIVDDLNDGVKITQVSISLGACERKTSSGVLTTDDNFFAVMSGLGASIFVSTGDHGSRECGKQSTSFFATSPNVTGAGGTTLTLNADGSEKTEVAWSGSGGGLSTFFKAPKYQTAAKLGFKKRAIPDISADANPGTGALVIYNGFDHQIGGTSLSAPILAGLTALANGDRLAHKKAPLGLLNSRIYSIPAANFRDITSGNNTDYTAGPGYDLVTGLGAPIMSTLIPTLTGQK
jgi:kumamolisin